MNNNPKFLHLAHHIHESLFRAPVMIGGFYGWHKAFNGEFHLYPARKGRLENYDILFVGLSRPELDGMLISKMREEIGYDTKTKIVVCIDYAIELWQGTFNPHALELELMKADIVFISEPAMLSHVRSVLNNRKHVHHLMHPTNIDGFRQFYKPKELRSEEIAVVIHRYDNNWLSPYLVVKDLPWDSTAVLLDPGIEQYLYSFFKFIRHGTELVPYIDWVSRKKVVLDSYHRVHTYGRTAVDNATLGIPTVGADWTCGQKILWPDLTTQCGDVYAQSELIKRLFTDENFYDDCVEKAAQVLPSFSYENKKKELLSIIYN